MQLLSIEWKHLDIQGETCDRCYDTGENLAAEIKRLRRALESKGIQVEFTETKLSGDEIPQSNVILFNGIPLEEILDIQIAENYCDSCSTLLGAKTYCRTVIFGGNEYEDVPAKAIRQAAYQVLGLQGPSNAASDSTGCCCKGGKCC